MKKLLLLSMAAITLAGCSKYHFVETTDKYYVPTWKKDVYVYLSPSEVPENAEVIGFTVCKTNKEHKAFKKARKIAAKHGANAMYVINTEQKTKAEQIMNGLGLTNFKDKFRIAAIYVPANSTANK